MTTHLTRRSLITTAAAAGASLLLPGTVRGATAKAAPPGGPFWDRILVMIELDGGNDGINTVIPYQISDYQTQRPTLKYTEGEVSGCQLGVGNYFTNNAATTTTFAMNPAMYYHLKDAWLADDLAVLLGLGYDNPNFSHFRSMDIWNAGCASNQFGISDSWLGRLLAQNNIAAQTQLTAHGVLLSRYSSNPLQKAGIDYLAMSTPKEFCDRSFYLPDTAVMSSASPYFEHHLRTQQVVKEASSFFRTSLMTQTVFPTPPNLAEPKHFAYTPPTFSPSVTFNSASSFEKRCKSIAEMICTLADSSAAKRLQIPVFKVQIGGFDNHDTQKAKHEDLLAQVGSGIANLRRALKEKTVGGDELWNRTLIMTYSEFGRRPEENGSKGTDHGTSNCHFLCGGKVNGGLYGTQSGLNKTTDWVNWNLVKREDYRRLPATAANWLGLDTALDTGLLAGFTPFDCMDL
jgi:uncharacterized protein (DUF1501 family)